MISPDCSNRSSPTRREFLGLGIGAFVVAAVPLAGSWRRRLVRRTVPLMGTIAEIAVVHENSEFAHVAIDGAFDELRLVDRLMSRFTDTSDVGRANRLAGAEPVPITRATAGVIREGLEWAESSDGAFDPCLGKAVRLWDVVHRTTPPPEDQVRPLAGRNLYRTLDLDTWRGGHVVRFTDADVELDLGGIAKGYGVDRAVRALRSRGIARAIVNVGGDLYALGESDDGAAWTVGIRSPQDPRRLAGFLAIRDAALATSGDYVQYFPYRGRRYHHLLDPTTGAPRHTAVRSVTVLAETCLEADAAATAVFGMARDQAEQLLRRRVPAARIVSMLGAMV